MKCWGGCSPLSGRIGRRDPGSRYGGPQADTWIGAEGNAVRGGPLTDLRAKSLIESVRDQYLRSGQATSLALVICEQGLNENLNGLHGQYVPKHNRA